MSPQHAMAQSPTTNDHTGQPVDASSRSCTKSADAGSKMKTAGKLNTNNEEASSENDPFDVGMSQAETLSPSESCRASSHTIAKELIDLHSFPVKNNPQYNVTEVLDKLDEYPALKAIRREGKYYLSMKDVVIEKQPRVLRSKRGEVIPTMHTETLGPIEGIFRRFCEEVLSVTRATSLPLSSQGERHLIWVSRIKAKHIIKFLNGNGNYIVNRFPGDVFLKDKQVMGVTLRQYMLERKNACFWRCGAPKENYVDEEDEASDQPTDITYRICQHMVRSMRTNKEGCTDSDCYNFKKRVCSHLDVFIPEVQSFCLYNSLQDFTNRLDDDLKGQLFICKPAYLYKGLGFRFFYGGAEFEEFYHMFIGKETSRHDFLVQRVVSNPYLFNGRKVDVRAFMLIMTLRFRRVVAFVHPGFCRVASMPYDPTRTDENELENPGETLSVKQRNRKEDEALQRHMQMLVCSHQTDIERADRARRIEKRRLYTDEEDRSKSLDAVFQNGEVLGKVKRQIKHIGKCLAEGIEWRVWDSYGCYQIFSIDLCVDANHKVWLLEVNSHAMSEVDLLSPTQRLYVPAVMMEALGLVAECMFKTANDLRLRKDPNDELRETGFLFARNFEMVFGTLTRRRTNYKHPRPPHGNGPPFYERIALVDRQIRKAARYKQELANIKQKLHDDKLKLKQRRAAKDEEES